MPILGQNTVPKRVEMHLESDKIEKKLSVGKKKTFKNSQKIAKKQFKNRKKTKKVTNKSRIKY